MPRSNGPGSESKKSEEQGQERGRIRRGEGRTRLLAAFVRLAAREGVDAVTYRSLAKEAGLTSGLASYHFPDRETLLREALSWAVAHALEESRLTNPNPNLDEFGSAVPGFVADAPQEAVFQYELLVRAWRDPEIRSQIGTLYEQYIDSTQTAIAALGIPADRALARLVFAVFDGLTIQQLIFDRREETEETIALLRRALRILPEVEAKELKPHVLTWQ
jgi:AcrR family transcriptional regulator